MDVSEDVLEDVFVNIAFISTATVVWEGILVDVLKEVLVDILMDVSEDVLVDVLEDVSCEDV